jgi:hypothetical protein
MDSIYTLLKAFVEEIEHRTRVGATVNIITAPYCDSNNIWRCEIRDSRFPFPLEMIHPESFIPCDWIYTRKTQEKMNKFEQAT